MISLTGDSTKTFVGDVANRGKVYVGVGSHAVFGGNTSGSGDFSGTGLIEFVDGFSPGNSPETVCFGGDVVFAATSAT